MFHLFNRNTRLVKSLTRASSVHDKGSEARDPLPSRRNSYNELWRDRQRRKVKGEAKNIDVENRWREISKVWQSVIMRWCDDDILLLTESGQPESQAGDQPGGGERDGAGGQQG